MKKIFVLYICQLPYLSMNNNYIKNFQKYLKLQTNRTKKKRYVDNYRCELVQNSQYLYVKFDLNLSLIK